MCYALSAGRSTGTSRRQASAAIRIKRESPVRCGKTTSDVERLDRPSVLVVFQMAFHGLGTVGDDPQTLTG